jgi:predicted naringenin-chalcone synthase
VGTAVSGNPYAQEDVLDLLQLTDPAVRAVFLNSAIGRRYLTVPTATADGRRRQESQGDLLRKHREQAVDMGGRALQECMKNVSADLSDIRFLCCVTSTGFLTPGLSAMIVRELGLDGYCARNDIVGMGCNAGLSGLNTATGWSAAHSGELAVMICSEACSAAYVLDSTMRTAVVNSLFGDGAAAVALVGGERHEIGGRAAGAAGPRVLRFASRILTERIDDMRYDWDGGQQKFSFFLEPDIPYTVGANAAAVVDRLLSGTGLRQSDISHWLVHSGGKKVIDAIMVNLGLTRHEVRHTIGVLHDYGNLSSGSFLFSYERLLREGVASPGEYGILMTMGPGLTIETALVQW